MADDAEPRLEIDVRERERRIYDRLRARIAGVPKGNGVAASDVLLLLPDLVVLLWRLSRDSRVPFGAKLIALAGVAYAISPIELLPEIILGPFGLIDDLLVAVAALSRVINHVHPDLVAAHWPGQGQVLDAIRRVTQWAESTLGRGITRLLGFARADAQTQR